MLFKTVEKGTRGAIIGLNNLMASLGVVFISKLGPYLFQTVSVKAPFVFVGLCDLFFILVVILLKVSGKFTK